MQNKLFTHRQSASCVSQSLSITQEIYKSFDYNRLTNTRGTFLGISIAFHKVRHEGLIFELKTYVVDGNLLKALENFLIGSQQRVVLNGQTSQLQNILTTVTQGSLLGPLLFLIYINDVPGRIT